MNKHAKKEIYQALQESTLAYIANDGKVQCAITKEWDLVGDVWRIEDATAKVIATTATLFSVKVSKSNQRSFHASALGNSLLRALKTDFAALRQHYPMHTFNPYVEEFIKQATASNAVDIATTEHALRGEGLTTYTKELNDFVDSLRKTGNSPEFKKVIADFGRKSNKNYLATKQLIDAHFEQCGRILALRFDVSYEKNKGWPTPTKDPVTYDETKKHREDLLKYLPKAVPKGSFLASVCEMEYGLDTKWHYHCLLLLDGSLVREDVTIARLIGEHWKKTITKGKGLYWNCNANKESYKSCGIGMVKHYDMEAREGLNKAVVYMTKPDYYIKLLVPGNDRTFWKTNMPKSETVKKGRHRTKTCDQPGAAQRPA